MSDPYSFTVGGGSGRGGAPVYESRVPLPRGPSVMLQPMQVPNFEGSERIGRAISEFGDALLGFGVKMERAQAETREAKLKTEYLDSSAVLRENAVKSTDFENAPAQFEEDHRQLVRRLTEQEPDGQRRAQLGLYFTIHGIAAGKEVRLQQTKNEADYNSAAYNDRSAQYLTAISNATTDIERQSIYKTWHDDIDKMVSSQWFSAVRGGQEKQLSLSGVDEVDARKFGMRDPAGAVKALGEGEFPAIVPQRRQMLIEHFQSQVGVQQTAEQQNVARTNPAGAVTNVGVVQPAHYGVLFNSVMQIESAGRADAVSSKGALGLSQIMPATAREMATRLGLPDVAALDDVALKERLLTDTALNKQLGRAYWDWLGARYQGSVPAMLAGYNAGPGRADAWVKVATEKFGPNYTIGQFASVIPERDSSGKEHETRGYLTKFAKQVGASMEAPAFARTAQLHAAASVGTILDQEDTARRQSYRADALEKRDGTNFADMFRNGVTPDPTAYSAAITANAKAAQYDPAAAKWLNDTLTQERFAPVREAGYRMAPAQLGAVIDNIEADHRARPVAQREIDHLNVLVETFNDVNKRKNSDPIGLAERAKLIPRPVVIDPNGDADTMAGALAARNPQAKGAQQFYGGTYKLLKPEEADALKVRYVAAGDGERMAILRAAGRSLDDRGLSAFAEEIGGDQTTAFIARTARDRPELAADMLRGQALLAQKDVQEKGEAIRAALQSKLGTLVYHDPALQEAAVQSAMYLDIARRSTRGALYDKSDTSGFEKALEDVMGTIVKRAGQRVPAPLGMRGYQFLDAMHRLDDGDLGMFGGAHGSDGRRFDAKTVGSQALLVPLAVGGSEYAVFMPQASAPDGRAAVITTEGAPLVIDMRDILARQSADLARSTTPYQRGRRNFRADPAQNYPAAEAP